MSDVSGTFDALEPRRKKVAIVGFATTTRMQAPYGDPAWEVWGMNQLYRFVPRLTRWWEMHRREDWLADTAPGTDYLGWLRACPVPTYMIETHADIPSSVAFPFAEIVHDLRLAQIRPDLRERGYFHSSVDYMMALAIHEGFEEVGIWGVDMAHDTEYAHQKPSLSFWTGLAHGRGLRVTLPTASALLNPQGYRYGYDPQPRNPLVEQLASRHRALSERRAQLMTELHACDGALQENAHWTEYARLTSRGAGVEKATSTNV